MGGGDVFSERKIFLCVLALFLGVRLAAWAQTSIVEDHDSMGYLRQAGMLLDGDYNRWNGDPDNTPFYPLAIILCSLPGWSLEIGARICSLLLSTVLFCCVWRIGRRYADPGPAAIGLVLLALSPLLIPLQFAVLSEPSYIATIYLAFFLFLKGYERPDWKGGALLGLVCGLSFLNRTEGILYLAFLPFLQLIHFVAIKPRTYAFSRLAIWTAAFAGVFLLLAVPQIVRVSKVVGTPVLNGREVWMAIMDSTDKSTTAALYGLDYRPDEVNIDYLRVNGKEAKSLGSTVTIGDKTRHVTRNAIRFVRSQIITYLTPVGALLFALGLFAVFRSGRRFETILIVFFLAANLLAPFLHNAMVRHVAIVVPLMLGLAGPGAVRAARFLTRRGDTKTRGDTRAHAVTIVLTASVIALWVSGYRDVFQPPDWRPEYSVREIQKPIEVIREASTHEGIGQPLVAARKNYVTDFGGFRRSPLPFCEFPELVTFLDRNDVEFVYLKYGLLKKFPFIDTFRAGAAGSRFRLLHRGLDAGEKTIELYRFVSEPKPQ
ncbi:MAG: glycosyltransferase family 39 protein [Planctomycetota bacterium]